MTPTKPPSQDAQHYTFGDNDVAALRLRLLAEAYAPSSAALLARVATGEGGAVDLGCGPGYTTELVAAALRPAWTAGLDRSERLLALARARCPALRFELHDVTAAPYPVPPAAAAYARFLLTHLPDPFGALRAFGALLLPGGALVLEETAELASDHPVLGRYYQLVEAMQAHYGQRMHVGLTLGGLGRAGGYAVEQARVEVLHLPAARMARLHALNLRTWGNDPWARSRLDAAELADLATRLERIARGEEEVPPVRSGLGQAVLRRR